MISCNIALLTTLNIEIIQQVTLQTALQKANFLGPKFLNGVHILCRALLQELILNKTGL